MPTCLNGLLVIDKPVGITSKDVSRILQKSLNSRKFKIGHVGTLDPNASGVLPIVLGKATRIQDFLLHEPKVYEFKFELGRETDSLDLDGELVKEQAVPAFQKSDLENILQMFVGNIQQIPPVYSAVKYRGKPLYWYARSGNLDQVPLDSLTRHVEVFENDLLGHTATSVHLKVRCSSGTYVRCLARDIAHELGTCATVTDLRRLSAAGSSPDDAVTLDQIEQYLTPADCLSFVAKSLISLDTISGRFPHVITDDAETKKLMQGGSVLKSSDDVTDWQSLVDISQDRRVFLRDNDGKAFGIGVVVVNGEDKVQIRMKRGLA